MTIGLFIPCYIDMLYPQVGMATVSILEKLKLPFEVPMQQTCCGQPLYNTGCNDEAANVAEKFLKDFAPYDCILTPSASCTAMIKHHYRDLKLKNKQWQEIASRTIELTEFLYEMIDEISFKNTVDKEITVHQSCHGLRELHLGSFSEVNSKSIEKTLELLRRVQGLKINPVERQDECCGFGGLFSIQEKEVSVAMGKRKINYHCQANSKMIVSPDMSCLMHLEGVSKEMQKDISFVHVAEILNEAIL